MKKTAQFVLILVLTAVCVIAQDKEDKRLEQAGKAAEEILSVPGNLPQGVIKEAGCVIILPSLKKSALGLGGSYGGVMTCRGGTDFKGKWGAPTMIVSEGKLDFEVAGNQGNDVVLLITKPRAANAILTGKVKLGTDIVSAAGPRGRDRAVAVDVMMHTEILSYIRSRGLFSGVFLSDWTLRPDDVGNKNLYGKQLDAKDIVLKGVVPAPASAQKLLDVLKLQSAAQRPAGGPDGKS